MTKRQRNESELISIWQKLRNEKWQKQELFVQEIISEVCRLRETLQFFSEDKYVGPTGFKHIDGTVHETCVNVLDGFWDKMEAFK